jgi:hypothetical protein
MCIAFIDLVNIVLNNPWNLPANPSDQFVFLVNIIMQLVNSFNGVC